MFFKKIFRIFLWAVLIFAASYIASIFIITRTHLFQEEVEKKLSLILDAQVNIQSISGMMIFIDPKLILSNVSIQMNHYLESELQKIKKMTIKINILQSIWSFKLIIHHLHIQEGRFFLKPTQSSNQDMMLYVNQYISTLHKIQSVRLENIHVLWIQELDGINHHNLNIKQLFMEQQDQKLIVRSLQCINGALSHITGNILLNNIEEILSITACLKMDPIDIKSILNVTCPNKNFNFVLEPWFIKGIYWIDWTPDHWHITSDLQTNQVDFKINDHVIPLSKLKGTCWLTGQGQLINSAHIEWEDCHIYHQLIAKNNLTFSRILSGLDEKWQLEIPEISLHLLSSISQNIASLFSKYNQTLSNLKITGLLKDIKIELPLSLSSQMNQVNFLMNATVNNMSCAAWNKIPALEQVNGKIQMNAESGVFSFDSRKMGFHLTEIFEKSLPFQSVKGDLSWTINPQSVNLFSTQLAFILEDPLLDSKASGVVVFNLNIPFEKTKSTELQCNVMLSNVNTDQINLLYPVKKLNSELNHWMKDSLYAGKADNIQFIWDGVVNRLTPKNHTWSLLVDLKDISLHYHEHWPDIKKLNTRLYLNKSGLSVQGATGYLFDSYIENISIDVPYWQKNIINIKVNSALKGKDFTAFLQQSALNNILKKQPDNWKFSGVLDINFQLSLPLNNADEADVSLSANLRDLQCQLLAQDITVEHIVGQAYYSTKKGLYSDKLKAAFLNAPIEFDILTSINQKTTQIAMKADKTSIEEMKRFMPIEFSCIAVGDLQYTANVIINHQTDELILEGFSHLNDLHIHLPAPYMKRKHEALESFFRITFHDKNAHTIAFQYGSYCDGNWYTQNDQLLGGEITLNPTSKAKHQITVGEFILSGQLDRVDGVDWYRWYQKYIACSGTQNAFDRIVVTLNQLQINQLIYDRYTINQLDISGTILSDSKSPFSLLIQSQEIKGQLIKQFDEPCLLRLDYVALPLSYILDLKNEMKNDETQILKQHSILKYMNLSFLSECDVNIERLIVDNESIGSFNAYFIPDKSQWTFKNIHADFYGISALGQFTWSLADSLIKTAFDGQLKARSFDMISKKFNLDIPFSMKKIKLDLQIEWPGDPHQFCPKNAKGNINFKVSSGYLKSNLSTNPLSFLGVLNADTLVRRLKFDFSDLFHSGIAFDYIAGEAVFEEGLMNFNTPMKISGPSVNILIEGVIDVMDAEMDMSMMILLPLVQNFSLLTLLLGQPFLSGSLYLLSKVAGKKLAKRGGMRYLIEGSLRNPIIIADKIFDNKFKRKLKIDNKHDPLLSL
ncbi:MAG: hypothetical protein HAW62_04560 [Endozoicomonadaceae bacterium]|nr:hypothetical protein [Endozoicomonadaceae bacterium]